MITVTEHKKNNHITYYVSIEDEGKELSHSIIKYQVTDVDIAGQKYLFIYDSCMNPIEDSYIFFKIFKTIFSCFYLFYSIFYRI